MQGREGQWRLDLEALRAQDGDHTRVRDQRLEQRRLAHTRFAVHDQAGRLPCRACWSSSLRCAVSRSRPTSTQ